MSTETDRPTTGFLITVEDLENGERTTMHAHAGDYALIPFAPCYRDSVQAYPGTGTQQVTMKGHRPQGSVKVIEHVEPAPCDACGDPHAEHVDAPSDVWRHCGRDGCGCPKYVPALPRSREVSA